MKLRDWLIQALDKPSDVPIITMAVHEFGVSRRTVYRELRKMTEEGLVTAHGRTRARHYNLRQIKRFSETVQVTPDSEDVVWRQKLAPLVGDLPRNVQRICQHGFTEMFNNVLDHSGSATAGVQLIRTAATVTLMISDQGVGIFKKIQQAYKLDDTRHAIFELTKGKLTTDPNLHTGEGIFFTSRMFDHFELYSSDLCLVCTADRGDWLFDVRDQTHLNGTHVLMRISLYSSRTVNGVLERFAVAAEGLATDYGFSRTHIPLRLAQCGEEELVSRSQAKRVLARVGERFKEVMLDFDGIESIGQAFADEIFRVFKRRNPDVNIRYTNAKAVNVMRMIAHVLAGVEEEQARQAAERAGQLELEMA
jgi:anti-sigma regulatory factor (Ser/Thr protein kinase)